jgi:hypothetical protein
MVVEFLLAECDATKMRMKRKKSQRLMMLNDVMLLAYRDEAQTKRQTKQKARQQSVVSPCHCTIIRPLAV